MFESLGRTRDPHRPRRLLLALALSVGVSGGGLASERGAAALISALVAVWERMAPRPSAPPIPRLPMDRADLAWIEVVLEDPELTDAELPDAPPEAPPEPPAPPAADPVADAEVPTPPEAPAEVEAPPPEPPEAPSAELVDAAPPDEVAPLPPDDHPKLVEDARKAGLLALKGSGIDVSAFDAEFMDGERRWDGIFGPLDAPLLTDAIREGRVAIGGTAVSGPYRVQMSQFGSSAFGGPVVMRIPPSRELEELGRVRYPREARRAGYEDVTCTLYVAVDPAGAAVRMEVVDCPEVFVEEAKAATGRSRWKTGQGEARVKHVVEFER